MSTGLRKTVVLRSYDAARLLGGWLGPQALGLEAAEDLVLIQLRRQHALWNQLVDLELVARMRFRGLLVDAHPRLGRIYEQLDAVEAGGPHGPLAEQRSGLLAEAALLQKAARRSISALAVTALDVQRREEARALGKASQLWWCHYEDVLARFDVARRSAMKEGRLLRPAPARRAGSGALTLRLTGKGPDSQEFLAGRSPTSMCRIEEPTQDELGAMKLRKGDGGQRRVAAVRVGAPDEAGCIPVVRLLFTMHRGFPVDLPLKTVSLVREEAREYARTGGTRVGWKLRFTFSGLGAGHGEGEAEVPADADAGAKWVAGAVIAFGCELVRLQSPDSCDPDDSERDPAVAMGPGKEALRVACFSTHPGAPPADAAAAAEPPQDGPPLELELPAGWVAGARRVAQALASADAQAQALLTEVREAQVEIRRHSLDSGPAAEALPQSAQQILDTVRAVLATHEGLQGAETALARCAEIGRRLDLAAALQARLARRRQHLFREWALRAVQVAKSTAAPGAAPPPMIVLPAELPAAPAFGPVPMRSNMERVLRWAAHGLLRRTLAETARREGVVLKEVADSQLLLSCSCCGLEASRAGRPGGPGLAWRWTCPSCAREDTLMEMRRAALLSAMAAKEAAECLAAVPGP